MIPPGGEIGFAALVLGVCAILLGLRKRRRDRNGVWIEGGTVGERVSRVVHESRCRVPPLFVP